MFGFHFAPYTDFQQKNLDWIIKRLGELSDQSAAVSSLLTRVTSLEQRVTYLENWRNTIIDNLLPDVGPADNGKVLGVSNGVWSLVEVSGDNTLPTVLNDETYSLNAIDLTGTTGIRDYAFYNAHITSIEMPNTVEYIGDHAFQNSDLESPITIPASVTSIGAEAFQGTEGKVFIFEGTTPPTISSDAFASNYAEISQLSIYVPDDSVNAYKTATGWSSYTLQIHPISEYNP